MRDFVCNNLKEQLVELPVEAYHQRWAFNVFTSTGVPEANSEEDFGGVMRELLCEACVPQIFDADRQWFEIANTADGSGLSYQVVSIIKWLQRKADDTTSEEEMADVTNQITQCRMDFRFVGRILGKMLLDGCPVHAHLSRLLFKHLVDVPQDIDDLWSINESVYRNLMLLSDIDAGTLGLDFEATLESPFGIVDLELKPGGAEINLTDENKVEYAELYMELLLSLGEPERQELAQGLHDIVPKAWLSVFTVQELELLMCGMPKIDLQDWKNNTIYSGTYAALKGDHPTVSLFWEAVKELTDEQMSKLLQFSTGTASLPVEGFHGLQSKAGARHPFHITSIEPHICPLPRAHTCFNKVDLPTYTDFNEMLSAIELVIELECGFGLGE